MVWTSALSESDCVTAMRNVRSVPAALKAENIAKNQIQEPSCEH